MILGKDRESRQGSVINEKDKRPPRAQESPDARPGLKVAGSKEETLKPIPK
jgi:hypothetical protein